MLTSWGWGSKKGVGESVRVCDRDRQRESLCVCVCASERNSQLFKIFWRLPGTCAQVSTHCQCTSVCTCSNCIYLGTLRVFSLFVDAHLSLCLKRYRVILDLAFYMAKQQLSGCYHNIHSAVYPETISLVCFQNGLVFIYFQKQA